MSDRTLRVALWAPVPPPMGGIARWTMQYLEAAPRHGLDLRLVNVAPPTDEFSEDSSFRWDRARHAGSCVAQLAGLVARRNVDVVHLTTSLFWGTAREATALALCRTMRVPALLHIRGSNQYIAWRQGLPAWKRRGLDATLRAADTVLVLSQELQDYLSAEVSGVRVERIGNFVADPELAQGHAVLPPRSKLRVLFVGAVTPLKGVGELARAVLGLPQCELVLVGAPAPALDAAAERALHAALADLRATGRLVEMGALPPDRTLAAYREADVFCLPTYREGLPNVLLEAMVAALPAVVTPVGAIPEVVHPDLAEIVPVGDVGSLQAAIGRLAADPARRKDLGQRARQSALARFGVDGVIEQYVALYRRLSEGVDEAKP
ncbi:MAG: glycosyltransferase family 4 protein [Deltaproteobacteria bacterium]|nr:glycosyltransferase family 4 protein [Deltaproteobacteria bacterium]